MFCEPNYTSSLLIPFMKQLLDVQMSIIVFFMSSLLVLINCSTRAYGTVEQLPMAQLEGTQCHNHKVARSSHAAIWGRK